MLEVAALTYGMLLSFVFAGASRNRKLERANPPVLNYVGYVLVGATCTMAVLLAAYAAWGLATGKGM
ncbi:MAG: hypothetical protein DI544_15010 [Sphingomonas taxi]|uniref:Uncharacterized protein n=1 Tax=Sphingomonas taxi TaxID=1549858 RepID=A0A2W5QTL7_9SPHN|nr:MAG: hypothetical protein DI544_15010 [Sphingomonas taxi]